MDLVVRQEGELRVGTLCHILATTNCSNCLTCHVLGIIIPILWEGRLRPSEVQGLDQGSLEAGLEYVTPCWAVPGRLVGPRSGQDLSRLLTVMAAESGGSIRVTSW